MALQWVPRPGRQHSVSFWWRKNGVVRNPESSCRLYIPFLFFFFYFCKLYFYFALYMCFRYIQADRHAIARMPSGSSHCRQKHSKRHRHTVFFLIRLTLILEERRKKKRRIYARRGERTEYVAAVPAKLLTTSQPMLLFSENLFFHLHQITQWGVVAFSPFCVRWFGRHRHPLVRRHYTEVNGRLL